MLPTRHALFDVRRLALAASTLALAALTACGGGGGGDSSGSAAAGPLSLSGVAATGAALAGASVDVKCASGTGTATTNADGSYTVNLTAGSLPCIVKVTSGSTVLHSVATGTGSSATVNVTPLTDLVVAQAAGGSAASLYTTFDAAAQAKVTPAALAGATSAVAAALQSVVSLAGVNPFTDTLVAASGGNPGNALDAKLDTLAAALAAAQLSLPELGSAIAANGAAAATVVAAQLQPSAATCPSLHSGTYRVINPNERGANFTTFAYRKLVFDAVALTQTDQDGTPLGTAVPVPGKPCHFTADNGRADLVVSPAGVVLNRYLANDGTDTPRLAIAFPEQTHTLADFAGTWNTVEFFRDTPDATTAQNSYANVTIDATGTITSSRDCPYLAACSVNTPPPPFTVNATGGFDLVEADGTASRFFIYRAPSGGTMFVGITPGGIIIASKVVALGLPAVGEIATQWSATMNNQGVAGALVADVRTVTAVDAAAGAFSRSSASSGLRDTFVVDSPRPGMRTRASTACTDSTGTATACPGLITMPLAGMGVVVFGSTTAGSDVLGITVQRPAGSTSTGVQSAGGGGGGLTPPAPTPTPANTLLASTGETSPLGVNFTIGPTGLINGGTLLYAVLNGTATPCVPTADNAATCSRWQFPINRSSQSGPFTTAGVASGGASIGPLDNGISMTGTLTGTTWTGTYTKVATPSSPGTGSGTFSVVVAITPI